ncbi:hypothetical protein ACFL07_00345 [Pseudomonadota bacterium]
MKKLLYICLLAIGLLPLQLGAYDWTGKTVRLSEGLLLCDYFSIDKALTLIGADDRESVAVMVQKGQCLIVGESSSAVITKDAGKYSENELVEVTIKGESAWTTKSWDLISCCYKKTASGELEYIKKYPAKASGSACVSMRKNLETMKRDAGVDDKFYKMYKKTWDESGCQ